MLKNAYQLIAVLTFAGWIGAANATLLGTYNEAGDASNLFASAQNAGSDIAAISGSMDSDSGDIFSFSLSNAYTIDFAVTSNFDPVLFLWDSLGNGIVANDDLIGLQSGFTSTLAAGSYALGICSFSCDSLGTGDLWDPGFSIGDHLPPAGYGTAIDVLGFAALGNGFTSYTISLTANVPEPGTIFLLGLGFAGLGFILRKKA